MWAQLLGAQECSIVSEESSVLGARVPGSAVPTALPKARCTLKPAHSDLSPVPAAPLPAVHEELQE